MNTNWNQHPHFAALDWASDHHDVVVVDRTGAIVAECRCAHTADGWAEFTRNMQPYTGCPLALETSSGPAMDQLLQRGWALYPINPKAAERYRERKASSGTKHDRHDAWSLADALRTDGHAWRVLLPQDQTTATLRALCRDELALIEQRTALVNQLIAALREYYRVALELFRDWTQPHAWALIQQFPTPQQLQNAGKRKWEKFLHTHRLWRSDTAPERLQHFAAANALPASPAVVTAKSLLAASLVRVLHPLELQLDEYRRRIQETFTQHPDHDPFGSLPGAGEKLAPRLLSELGSQRAEYPDADALCCQAGVGPNAFRECGGAGRYLSTPLAKRGMKKTLRTAAARRGPGSNRFPRRLPGVFRRGPARLAPTARTPTARAAGQSAARPGVSLPERRRHVPRPGHRAQELRWWTRLLAPQERAGRRVGRPLRAALGTRIV